MLKSALLLVTLLLVSHYPIGVGTSDLCLMLDYASIINFCIIIVIIINHGVMHGHLMSRWTFGIVLTSAMLLHVQPDL